MCAECGRPRNRCVCEDADSLPRNDGVVRVRREVKGRAGKTVTTVSGLPLRGGALEVREVR